jgi:hypothetical protein
MHAVADAHGAVICRLDHALGDIGLAGMQRDGHAGGAHAGQRRGMARRREARLRPGQVETHHAAPQVADGELGGALHLAAELVAHAAQDQAARQRALRQARQHGIDRRLGWHAVGLEQQRSDAELGQHGAVGACVLGRLEGHAPQRGGRGHRGHGEVEALQVLLQAVREGVLVEPAGEPGHVRRRAVQAAFGQQLQKGGHTQSAVQVFVQKHLRHLPGQGFGRAFEHGEC